MTEAVWLDATAQAELLRTRELSPVELVDAHLERIDRLDGALGSFVTVCHEQARAEARRAEERLRRPASSEPPFLGLPVSVKDTFETAGVLTTFSSRAFARYLPANDAAVVRRLAAAGFVLLGKTNTPELGARAVTESELNGACRNPWDLGRTPGGSSGGAAAALAAALCPASLGSDGGGSIRIPASCCGVVGLKPSRGRVSGAPRGDALAGLVVAGPLARSVRDAAALLDVLAGPEPGDVVSAPPPERPFAAEVGAPPGRLRVAVTAVPPLDTEVDPACAAAATDAAALLAGLGHEVVEARPDWDDDDFVTAFTHVWQAASAAWRDAPGGALEPLNRVLREEARRVSSLDYVASLLRLQALARRTLAFWSDHDVLVTPTLALPPVPVGWTFDGGDPWDEFERGWRFAPFTQIANLTGQPAIALPLLSRDGLPIGVQLVGPPAGEALLLRLAAQLEAARPWSERRPATA